MPKTFTPWEYQRRGADWLKDRNAAALFAGMGLGKSAMTLLSMDELMCDGASKGALIVAPLRVSVLTWPREIAKWENFKWMKIALLRTPEGVKAWKDGSADIYLLNYERIPQFCKQCLHGRRKTQMPVDTVVWDELSKAKNPSSKRINTFRHYRGRFDRHWGLTGTPTPNGYEDLFAQVRLLDDGKALGKGITAFRDNFFKPENPHAEHSKLVPLDGTKGYLERKLSDLALVLRSEDYLDIPPTNTIDIDVPLPKDAKRVYEEMLKEFLAELKNTQEIEAANAGVRVNKLIQITSGAIYDEEKVVHHIHNNKVKALQKLQKELKEPLLVVTRYRHEQARILEACPGAELFDEGSIDRWNAGKIKMIVAHPLSIGHGIDGLQEGGRTVVWFSPTYSADEYNQMNARLARTGQGQETNVYRLLSPGTIDDAAIEVVEGKVEGEKGFLRAVKNLQMLAAV